RLAEGVPVGRRDAPQHRPPQVGARPPRAVRRAVAARAAPHRLGARRRRAGGDGRLALDGLPRPAGEPDAGRAGGLPAARGLRLRLRRDREDRPAQRGQLPAAVRPCERHIDQGRPRFETSREQRDELARRFFAAAQLGDTNALIELLAADVVVYGDGGGKAPSWTEPIYGREPRREADGRHARAGRAARRVATGSPASWSWTRRAASPGSCRSRSPTASSRPSAGSPTRTSSPTSARSPTSAPSCAAVGRPSRTGRLSPASWSRAWLRGRDGCRIQPQIAGSGPANQGPTQTPWRSRDEQPISAFPCSDDPAGGPLVRGIRPRGEV